MNWGHHDNLVQGRVGVNYLELELELELIPLLLWNWN